MRNIWKEGVFGVVTGDALGCPVQFETREEVAEHPVTGMRGHGTFNLPAGSWTDDSSLTLALLDSICETGALVPEHIMGNFVAWLDEGKFTPYGYAYDIGTGTMRAIENYKRIQDPELCGGRDAWNNGNGSLMRIMPACLYCCARGMEEEEAVRTVHLIGGLTHGHIRAKIACGLYWFMIREILNGTGSLVERLQAGLDRGFAFYDRDPEIRTEVDHYRRLRDLAAFAQVPAAQIRGSGYVVDTLEAAVWSLITTESFRETLLKAVNLGEDTDTVGAIAGGPAALYYGYEAIPSDWISELKRKEWIEKLCEKAEQEMGQ
ncbi:MAG: ADP-ribosylglycohydrolase family protein [Clostridiales bacterium]|nr:ADP-ribosylglycohydrolase family protein [Clostridiales bacterium]